MLKTGIVLCVVLALFGLFFESLDDALYETIKGKPLLTTANLIKLGSLSKEKQTALEIYGLKISNHGDTTFVSYWNRVGGEGFTVNRDKDGMYNFAFSVAGDSGVDLRKNNSFNQKDANRVVDHIVGRKQKEWILSFLDKRP